MDGKTFKVAFNRQKAFKPPIQKTDQAFNEKVKVIPSTGNIQDADYDAIYIYDGGDVNGYGY